jgi:hypothetical protein
MLALIFARRITENDAGSGGVECRSRFEEISESLKFAIDNSLTPNKNRVETTVAGVTPIDYEGDGFQESFCVTGLRFRRSGKGTTVKNRLLHKRSRRAHPPDWLYVATRSPFSMVINVSKAFHVTREVSLLFSAT